MVPVTGYFDSISAATGQEKEPLISNFGAHDREDNINLQKECLKAMVCIQ